MSRPLDHDKRHRLAARAFEVLRARGVHRTSMKELAEALGIKRPTLYFYFKDVGAIFEDVLDHTYRALADHVGAAVAGAGPHPLDRLRAVIDAVLGYHKARPELIGLLFQLWAVGGHDLERVLARERDVVRAVRAQIIAELTAARGRGQVGPCEPERIVDLCLAVLDGALVQKVIGVGVPQHAIDELMARVIEPLRVTDPALAATPGGRHDPPRIAPSPVVVVAARARADRPAPAPAGPAGRRSSRDGAAARRARPDRRG